MTIHNWLKNYVFIRVIRRDGGSKMIFLPTFFTFTVAAIWHGFYPGYFIFFLSGAVYDYFYQIAGRTYLLVEWMPKTIKRILIL
jgi:lysophospholipid acyltransferase